MRPTVALATVLLAVSTTCTPTPAPRVPALPTPAASSQPSPTASDSPSPAPVQALAQFPTGQVDAAPDFARDVRPILAQRCEPCHEPGGKMYARLPFDDPATVASHPAGILKRLKGDDKVTVERWIAAQVEQP